MILNDLYEKDSGVIGFIAGSNEFSITVPDHEEGFFLLVRNDGVADMTVKIKEGNSIYAMGDLEVAVGPEEVAVINLKNTGRFKNVYGENSGKILGEVSGNGAASTLSMAAVSL